MKTHLLAHLDSVEEGCPDSWSGKTWNESKEAVECPPLAPVQAEGRLYF